MSHCPTFRVIMAMICCSQVRLIQRTSRLLMAGGWQVQSIRAERHCYKWFGSCKTRLSIWKGMLPCCFMLPIDHLVVSHCEQAQRCYMSTLKRWTGLFILNELSDLRDEEYRIYTLSFSHYSLVQVFVEPGHSTSLCPLQALLLLHIAGISACSKSMLYSWEVHVFP